MTSLRRYVPIAVSFAAVLLAFRIAERLDIGEESGGRLTRPMILACFASVPFLTASIVCGFRNPKFSNILWAGGTILAVPLASLRLAQGLWSLISPWPDASERAPFYLDWYCIALLVCLFAPLAMKTWYSRQ
ncbi:MAG: hypothetical protein WBL74_08795 [Novosphingobium sp.]|uniref:hypothetical protein n=1 Tax=Novosphingobium sp. TaxID=1874826 RepID=UPI003C7EC11F